MLGEGVDAAEDLAVAVVVEASEVEEEEEEADVASEVGHPSQHVIYQCDLSL